MFNYSPSKDPLSANINITNIPSTQTNVEDSMSILQNLMDTTCSNVQDNAKRYELNLQGLYIKSSLHLAC